MVAVTRYQRNQTLAVVPAGPRLSAQDLDAGGVANTLQQIGQDTGDLAVRRADQDEQAVLKQQADQQSADAGNRLATFKQSQLQAFQAAKDQAPAGAPNFTKAYLQSYDDAAKTTLQGVTDPQVRQYLDEGMQDFRTPMTANALDFESGAIIGKKKGDLNSAISTSRNVVASNPQQFQASLGQTLAAIDASGLPAADRQQLRTDATQGMASSAVFGTIQQNPYAALKQLNGGQWDSFLDADHKSVALDQADAEIKRREAEAKQQAAQALQQRQADFEIRYQDFTTSAQAGVIPTVDGKPGGQPTVTPGEAIQLYKGPTGQMIARKITTAMAIGQDARAVTSNDPTQDAALIQSLSPQPGGAKVFTDEDSDRLDAVTKAVTAKRTLFAKDPATAATQTNTAVASAWNQVFTAQATLGQPQGSTVQQVQALAKTAIQLSSIEQTRQGVDPVNQRILPVAAVDLAKQQIAGAAPAQVANVVDGINAVYGVAGMKEIVAAGAPSSIIPIAGASDPGDAPWRDVLIKAGQQPAGELAKQALLHGVKEGDIDTAIAGQDQAKLDGIPGVYLDAVKTVAMQQAALGMNAQAAVKFAMAPFNQGYGFHPNASGGAYAVPSKFDDGKVQGGLQAFVASIDKLVRVAPEDDASGNPASADNPGYRVRQQVAALKSGRYGWVNNATGDGVILTYETGDPVLQVTDDNQLKPVEVKFSDAQAVTPARPFQAGKDYGPAALVPQNLPTSTVPASSGGSSSGTKGRSRRMGGVLHREAPQQDAPGDEVQSEIDNDQADADMIAKKPAAERTPQEQALLDNMRDVYGYDPEHPTPRKKPRASR